MPNVNDEVGLTNKRTKKKDQEKALLDGRRGVGCVSGVHPARACAQVCWRFWATVLLSPNHSPDKPHTRTQTKPNAYTHTYMYTRAHARILHLML
jgi:hypothetical protein